MLEYGNFFRWDAERPTMTERVKGHGQDQSQGHSSISPFELYNFYIKLFLIPGHSNELLEVIDSDESPCTCKFIF